MRLFMVSTMVAFSLSWPAYANAQTAQQLLIRWDAYLGAPPAVEPGISVSTSFTVLERRSIASGVARQRNPELSSDQMLVRAVNGRGLLVHAQLIPDPRILRSEASGPAGELTGELLHHATPAFLVTIPDNPAITELRLYHPRWTGTEFVLDLLGTIALD